MTFNLDDPLAGVDARDNPICIGCHKNPEDLGEYIDAADEYGITPIEYVKREEGTYNPANGHFTCTVCYINLGMPASPKGWVAP